MSASRLVGSICGLLAPRRRLVYRSEVFFSDSDPLQIANVHDLAELRHINRRDNFSCS
jgi:hypothetical protein